MKKAPLLGLVCSGPVSRTSLTRLTKLRETLGPIKSSSVRAASRAANNLSGGTAVDSYEQLAEAKVILISVPDEELEQQFQELLKVRPNLEGCTVVVCWSQHGTECMGLLRDAGAAVGSIDNVPGSQDQRFVVEGDPVAVRSLRDYALPDDAGILEIAAGTKPIFLAATTSLSVLHVPVAALSLELLQMCNVTLPTATSLAMSLLSKSWRSYLHSGKRAVPDVSDSLLGNLKHSGLEPSTVESLQDHFELLEEWRVASGKLSKRAQRQRKG